MDALMEAIWKAAAQPGKDGERYIFFGADLDLRVLYSSGFVDYKRHPLKEWISAFKSSRRKDGSYLITHGQWMEKSRFYYDGPIGAPFDPMTIVERTYTEAEFSTLLAERIIPNTFVDRKMVPEILSKMREAKKLVHGKIQVDRKVKKMLDQFVEDYPNPLRRLEVANEERKKTEARKSGFSANLSTQQIVATKLEQLSQKGRKEASSRDQPKSPWAPDVPSLSLKDLKKKKSTPGRV